ncbi:MAG: hypothetical protein H7Y31_13250, partial [Chitinophagaceae bacterium]|nr:hypothetical protein [Chitinophagaceae bacterium]
MISIIICSADPRKLSFVTDNITNTIGLPFEVIAIDNSNGQYGICEAYNTGAKKATHSFLCFMHEDVFFETDNWGEIVCRHLNNPSIGLIGIAGGDAKSIVPSSWSIPVFSNEINITQHSKKNPAEKERQLVSRGSSISAANRVVVLDGVWLCTRKTVFGEYQFDQKTFTGFHGYD